MSTKMRHLLVVFITSMVAMFALALTSSSGTVSAFYTGQQHLRTLSKRLDVAIERANGEPWHNQHVDVVVIAPSAAAWAARRARLRQQFARNMQLVSSNQSAVFKFALGTTGLSSDLVDRSQAEQAKFADLLFFDCIDKDEALNLMANWSMSAGPSSTTCKVRTAIVWAVEHYTFQYFFRLGDDSYLRIDRFLEMLLQKQLPTGKAVIGQILQHDVHGTFHSFPQGMGYGSTPEVCHFISAAAPWLLDTAPEDGVMAKWLFAIGADFVHCPAWRDMATNEPCDEDMILTHRMSDEQWASISSDGLVKC